MRHRDAAGLAMMQIRAQKLKTFFGVLGVVIGVMFLITVVSVVEGLNRYMEEDFARQVFGLNTITVRRTPSVQVQTAPELRREWRRRPRLTMEDASAVTAGLTVPALVAVQSHATGMLEAEDGTQVENVWLTAASADFFRIREFMVDRGRLYGPPEDRLGAPVVVLGHETAEVLFGALDPLGRTVRVNGFPLEIIGVLQSQGRLFGFSLDNRAIAPARSAMARFVSQPGQVDEILIRAADSNAMSAAMLEVEAVMRVRHRLRPTEANSFEIETAEDSMAFWKRLSTILFIAFPTLVGIALVVGGMVIMNIMLVSVAERTREIGIRMALGARRQDIQAQVVLEGVAISGLGAALGIGIGIALAVAVRSLSPLPASIAPTWIVVAALLGTSVGVLAGLYPASRAAGLDPVVALREE